MESTNHDSTNHDSTNHDSTNHDPKGHGMTTSVGVETTADKFINLATKIRREAAPYEYTRLENTPKRRKQSALARLEASNLHVAADAAESIGKAIIGGTLPDALANIKPTKAEIRRLTARRRDTSKEGYYDVCPTDELEDTSELARTLREWLDSRGVVTHSAAKLMAESLYRAVLDMNIPGFFPTPGDAARRMVAEAEVRVGDKVLEPSAGRGDLADAAAECVGAVNVTTCEFNHTLRSILAERYEVIPEADFLSVDPVAHGRLYDAVVMNPPFEVRRDAEHIMHAAKFLRPGGRLVALCSPALFFATDAKSKRFRDWFDSVGGERVGDVDGFARTKVVAKMIRVVVQG